MTAMVECGVIFNCQKFYGFVQVIHAFLVTFDRLNLLFLISKRSAVVISGLNSDIKLNYLICGLYSPGLNRKLFVIHLSCQDSDVIFIEPYFQKSHRFYGDIIPNRILEYWNQNYIAYLNNG